MKANLKGNHSKVKTENIQNLRGGQKFTTAFGKDGFFSLQQTWDQRIQLCLGPTMTMFSLVGVTSVEFRNLLVTTLEILKQKISQKMKMHSFLSSSKFTSKVNPYLFLVAFRGLLVNCIVRSGDMSPNRGDFGGQIFNNKSQGLIRNFVIHQ